MKCKVKQDPTGNTPLWECECYECRELEQDLDDYLASPEWEDANQ